MKIIRHGNLVIDKYSATCSNCECEFKYCANDVEPYENNPHSFFVRCPDCGHIINAISYNAEQKIKV